MTFSLSYCSSLLVQALSKANMVSQQSACHGTSTFDDDTSILGQTHLNPFRVVSPFQGARELLNLKDRDQSQPCEPVLASSSSSSESEIVRLANVERSREAPSLLSDLFPAKKDCFKPPLSNNDGGMPPRHDNAPGEDTVGSLKPVPQGTGHSEVTRGYKCMQCPNTYRHSYMLDLHAAEAGHSPYFCQLKGCMKFFSRRDTFRRHQLTTHSAQRKSWKCVHCAKRFKRRDGLTQHRRERRCLKHTQKSGKFSVLRWIY
jgi:DNA-directed RNA polymerase subunit RPC12/RpoP